MERPAPVPCRAPASELVCGYELGPTIGIGTYGEVRCARVAATGLRVAIKIVDQSRFQDATRQLLAREIEIMKSLHNENCIRLIEVIDKVEFEGTWCTRCACTGYCSLPNGECANCGAHDGTEHSGREVRNVMFIVQELAAAGELFGILMHCGPLEEDYARFYFRQLINGACGWRPPPRGA